MATGFSKEKQMKVTVNARQAAVITLGTLLAAVLMLSGCANTATMRVEVSTVSGSRITVVPTGAVKLEGVSSGIGSAFGILGVLIEHAATESSRETSAQRAEKNFPANAILGMAATEIASLLRAKEKFSSIEVASSTLNTTEFTSWFNGDKRTDLLAEPSMHGNLILDFGFQSLTVNGSYAGGALGVRLIDSRSGNVIGRARVFGVGQFGGGVKIAVDQDQPEYDAAVKAAFERLVRQLVGESIQKLL